MKETKCKYAWFLNKNRKLKNTTVLVTKAKSEENNIHLLKFSEMDKWANNTWSGVIVTSLKWVIFILFLYQSTAF